MGTTRTLFALVAIVGCLAATYLISALGASAPTGMAMGGESIQVGVTKRALTIDGTNGVDRVQARQVEESCDGKACSVIYVYELLGPLKVDREFGWLDGPKLERYRHVVASGTLPLIVFDGHDGDDFFDNATRCDSRQLGGEGDDELRGGSASDTIDGGEGSNTIDGLGGDDVLRAGTKALNPQVQTIRGGAGADAISIEPGVNSRLIAYGGDGDAAARGGADSDDLYGEAGADVIAGGPGRDVIDGGPGADKLLGQAGDDTIEGGPGADLLRGGLGSDELRGGPGDDTLKGDGAADRLYGDDGDDRLEGGFGEDELFGGRGRDHLDGQKHWDVLDGNSGDDTCIVLKEDTTRNCVEQ